MRLALPFLALFLACNGSPPEIDRIEIRNSGWVAVDIELNRAGQGRYRVSDYPDARNGSFSVAPQRFDQLRERLEPFQRQAVAFTDASAREFAQMECPDGLPEITDAGAVYIRWHGPGVDRHYLALLGCDAGRNAPRNNELLSIIASLPVPLQR